MDYTQLTAMLKTLPKAPVVIYDPKNLCTIESSVNVPEYIGHTCLNYSKCAPVQDAYVKWQIAYNAPLLPVMAIIDVNELNKYDIEAYSQLAHLFSLDEDGFTLVQQKQ